MPQCDTVALARAAERVRVGGYVRGLANSWLPGHDKQPKHDSSATVVITDAEF